MQRKGLRPFPAELTTSVTRHQSLGAHALTADSDVRYYAWMEREIGVVMDPIGSIKIGKDSTFAMMLAARHRGWRVHYMELSDLFMQGDRSWARTREVEVQDQKRDSVAR